MSRFGDHRDAWATCVGHKTLPALSKAGLGRRRFLLGAAAVAATAAGAGTIPVDDKRGREEYDEAVRATWRHSERTDLPWPAAQRELVRYATLAANNHNSQPWRFRLLDRGILILPGFGARGPASDYDGHDLFVSLGCAVENMVQAAAAFGVRAMPSFDPGTGGIKLAFDPGARQRTALFDAIPHRQSTFAEFDGQPVPPEHARRLEASGGDGVQVLLLTDPRQLQQVFDFVMAALSAQANTTASAGALSAWIRYSYREALATRDGLFVKLQGLPVVPAPFCHLMLKLALTDAAQRRVWDWQIRRSSGIAVFVSSRNDPVHWIEAGRCGQRFALQATALGIKSAFMCLPLDVQAMRLQFAGLLGIGGWHPVAAMRFGNGPEMPRSLRRPVEQVILQA